MAIAFLEVDESYGVREVSETEISPVSAPLDPIEQVYEVVKFDSCRHDGYGSIVSLYGMPFSGPVPCPVRGVLPEVDSGCSPRKSISTIKAFIKAVQSTVSSGEATVKIERTQIAKQIIAPKARATPREASSNEPKSTLSPQRDTFVDNLKQFAIGATPGYGLMQLGNETFTKSAPGAAAGVTLGQAFGGPFLAMGALMMSARGFNAGIVGVGVGIAASIAAGISYASVDHATLQSPKTEIFGASNHVARALATAIASESVGHSAN